MKKLLAIAVLMGAWSTAHAQETPAAGSSEFSHNAEYRVRYQYDQNRGGDKDTDASRNSFVHRFKLGTSFRASENFSANLTLLHNASWGSNDFAVAGSGTGDSSKGTLDGINDSDNMLLVNEAYGTWMINDALTFRFGRGTFTMADGAVIASNDYEAHPYAFEGGLLSYEMEMMRVSGWGVKFAEYTAAAGGTENDPEANSFGLSLDFKTLPEVLKMVNVHVIKNNKDETAAAATTAAQVGQDILRYGLTVAGDVAGFDFKANYAASGGDYLVPGGATKVESEGSMYQIELGYTLAEIMNSRFFVIYHSDTGDKATSATKNEAYDPYFYDIHYNAGLMDVVKWGNLTYITLGYTLTPMDDLNVGVQYHMFERTEDSGAVTAGKNGSTLFTGTTGAENDDKKIGDEIDVYAEQTYDNGFSILARVGMFMPGSYLDLAAAAGDERSDTYTQAFIQGKMTF